MSIETAKMSSRGQLILPKDIRNAIGVTDDALFFVSTIDKDTVIMKKVNTDALITEFRHLRSKAKKLSAKEIEEEINAAR